MPWIKLHSKLLDAIAYDTSAKTLHVKFRTGRIVDHYNVPETVVENLRKAESPGFYYSYYISPSRRSGLRKSFLRSMFNRLGIRRTALLAAIYFVWPAMAKLF